MLGTQTTGKWRALENCAENVNEIENLPKMFNNTQFQWHVTLCKAATGIGIAGGCNTAQCTRGKVIVSTEIPMRFHKSLSAARYAK